MASICNDDRVRFGVMSGHDRKTLSISGTEWRFALMLERDAQRWFKRAKGQFQIFYKLGSEQPEYVPDFVAETADTLPMIKTKARDDVKLPELQKKAAAATQWCKHALQCAASVRAKPWRYLLVPHDTINDAARLGDMLRFAVLPRCKSEVLSR